MYYFKPIFRIQNRLWPIFQEKFIENYAHLSKSLELLYVKTHTTHGGVLCTQEANTPHPWVINRKNNNAIIIYT